MSDLIKVDVQGFPELVEKIKTLAQDKQKRPEILGILRQIAAATVSAAKSNAPVSKRTHIARRQRIQPGALKRSIGTITGRKGAAKENPTIYVGPRAKGSFNGWYGHFVEADTNVYSTGFKRKNHTKGANVGSASAIRVKKGQFFLKKAYEQTEGQVTSEAGKRIAAYIQKRIDRLG